MAIKFNRQKPRSLLISFFFRLNKILPLSSEKKLRLYLNLEWIFSYLVHFNTFKVYKPENHPIRIHAGGFIFKHLAASHNVLDIGCGYGDISFLLAQKAAKVTGIDYDEKAISKAAHSHRKENLNFVHDDAYNYLKNNHEKFHVLILSHLLEHLDDPKDFLLKFKNFFDYVYIELPDFEMSYMNQYRKDLNMTIIYMDNDHIWEFDREDIQKLTNECNLEIVEAEYRFGLQKYWCAVKK